MRTASSIFCVALIVIFATIGGLGLLNALSVEQQRSAIGVALAVLVGFIAVIVFETRKASRR